MTSEWRPDQSGRRVRLIRTQNNVVYLEWDHEGGPRTPYPRNDSSQIQSRPAQRQRPQQGPPAARAALESAQYRGQTPSASSETTGAAVIHSGAVFVPTVPRHPQSVPIGTHIRSAPEVEGFQVRESSFFKVGRVFSVVWPEPIGEVRTTLTSAAFPLVNLPRGTHVKERRMIVVLEARGNSWCCPIHTYQGRGVEKHGCAVELHVVICPENETPFITEGERIKGLQTREHIRVRLASGIYLHEMSRLNFGRVHTVEHNVAVKNFGVVPSGTTSFTILQARWSNAPAALEELRARRQAERRGNSQRHGRTDSGIGGNFDH